MCGWLVDLCGIMQNFKTKDIDSKIFRVSINAANKFRKFTNMCNLLYNCKVVMGKAPTISRNRCSCFNNDPIEYILSCR